MNVSSRMRDLFERTKRSPQLSTSVVRHQRIDEIVYNDLRDHSVKFDEAMTARPELPVDVDEDGNEIKREYDLAPDLWADLFHSHYTSGDRVEVEAPDQVRESHQMHRSIMEHFTHHEDHIATRAATRDDETCSALATRAAQMTLEKELATTLKDHAERAREMGQLENNLDSWEGDLQNLREKAAREHEQGGVSQRTQEQIHDLAQRKQHAREQLSEAIDAQDHSGMGGHVAGAVDQAAQAANEMADVWSDIAGTMPGERTRMSPDQAFELASRWKDNHQMREVLKLVGRFARDFRFQRSNRVQGGREEIVDVELGDDLTLLLPSEATYLAVPELEDLFYAKYADQELMIFETVGESPVGDGPIVTLLDRSGSMGGANIVWACAVVLALLSVAHRENRSFANIDFDTQILGEFVFPKGKAVDPELVTTIAGSGVSGGTDIDTALAAGAKFIESQPDFHSADIILITDGSDSWTEQSAAYCQAFADRGVRVHAFTIGIDETYYTNMAAQMTGGTAIGIADLLAPTDDTARLVQAIS